jgi:natural product precursor
MKEKIKASHNSFRLNTKFMQKVKGGDCRCGCMYADSGGSSVNDNHEANRDGGGKHSPNCPDHDPPPIE